MPISPLFSIIIPTWNRAFCIDRAIQSVLKQTCRDFEIIVSDDGSTDETVKLVSSLADPKIKILADPLNKGANVARNKGAGQARGQWLVFLDSDDQLAPEALMEIKKDTDNIKEGVGLLFYGTKNIKTNQPMSFLDKAKEVISYQDFIGKKKINGEYLVVLKREVWQEVKFPEDMMAFECFYWHQIAKKYHILAHNIFLRLYDSANKNRYTKKILAPEHIKKRIYSYEKFLDTFGSDVEKVNMKLYFYYVNVLAFSLFLDGQMKAGRKVLIPMVKQTFNLTSCLLYISSYFGRWPFLLVNRMIIFIS